MQLAARSSSLKTCVTSRDPSSKLSLHQLTFYCGLMNFLGVSRISSQETSIFFNRLFVSGGLVADTAILSCCLPWALKFATSKFRTWHQPVPRRIISHLFPIPEKMSEKYNRVVKRLLEAIRGSATFCCSRSLCPPYFLTHPTKCAGPVQNIDNVGIVFTSCGTDRIYIILLASPQEKSVLDSYRISNHLFLRKHPALSFKPHPLRKQPKRLTELVICIQWPVQKCLSLLGTLCGYQNNNARCFKGLIQKCHECLPVSLSIKHQTPLDIGLRSLPISQQHHHQLPLPHFTHQPVFISGL